MVSAPLGLARCALSVQTDRVTVNTSPIRNFYPPFGLIAPPLAQGVIRPQEAYGSFVANRNARNVKGQKLAEFPLGGNFNLEDLPWLGKAFLQGGISPTGGTGSAGDISPYVWTFNTDSTSDTVVALTGYYKDSVQEYRLANMIGRRLTINGAAGNDSLVQYSADFMAPDRATQSWTPPSDSARTSVHGNLSQVTVDDSSYTATALAAGVDSWSISIDNSWSPAYGCSNSLTYEEPGRMAVMITMTLGLRVDSTTAVEITKWLAKTERAIRVKLNGGTLDNAVYADDTAHIATFDMGGHWQVSTPQASGPFAAIGLSCSAGYTTLGSLNAAFKLVYTGNQANTTAA